jgi:hypothetical protein
VRIEGTIEASLAEMRVKDEEDERRVVEDEAQSDEWCVYVCFWC